MGEMRNLDTMKNQIRFGELVRSFRWGAFLVLIMWFVKLFEWSFDTSLAFLGIRPRSLFGLVGIVTSPLIHGDAEYVFALDSHMMSNSIPLFILMGFMFLFYKGSAKIVVPGVWIMEGFFVWLSGRPNSVHIGASGLIYGFAAFLFFSGVFRRDMKALAVAFVVAFLYGSMVWGVLPIEEGVSFESHLFGALTGVVFAWFLRKKDVKKRKYSWENEPEYQPHDQHATWNYPNKTHEISEEEIRHIRENEG